MARRLLFHEVLQTIMGEHEVYFQPPTNVEMTFPCIVYKRARADTKFADNSPYLHTKRYTVTVIDRNPDSEFPDKVASLSMCSHSTFFTKDNLNHDVFDVYF